MHLFKTIRKWLMLIQIKRFENNNSRRHISIWQLYDIFGENAVYYIGGSEALPAPLTPLQEAKIIDELKAANEQEAEKIRKTLIVRNLRLVVYIAKRFENTGIGIEDLVSIGTLGLMKAINTFKPDKNIKLATYASRCIENEILMFIRKNSHYKSDISLEEPLNVDWDGNELLLSDVIGTDEDTVHAGIEKEEEKNIIRKAVESLEERDRNIITLRFGLNDPEGKEKTQKEVADMLGISQSYISRLEKKIISNLRDRIEGFFLR